ncbi:Ribonuclease P protein subunit p14 [Ooceraea biroi]|uniref:Ribonuclease P protein subunit p14 n=1 Tax=Ooceraea biroi TaxID=2015173 RepID=A0A026WIH7_OOCBI|nr:Ribonuclease P protein subunit p14 [Ooceraea biroi]
MPPELPQSPDLEVTPVYLKKNILHAVRQLFGEEGARSRLDVVKFNRAERRFAVRCSSNGYTRLRAALTLATTYEGRTCVYTVHRASPNLLSLTADSRTYVHGARDA